MIIVALDLVPHGVITGVFARRNLRRIICSVGAVLNRAVFRGAGTDQHLRFSGIGQLLRRGSAVCRLSLGNRHFYARWHRIGMVIVTIDLVIHGVSASARACRNRRRIICSVGAVLNRAAGGRTSRYQRLRVAGIGQRIRRGSAVCRRSLGNRHCYARCCRIVVVSVANDLVIHGILTGACACRNLRRIICSVGAVLNRAVFRGAGTDQHLRFSGIGQLLRRGSAVCRRSLGNRHRHARWHRIGMVIVANDFVIHGVSTGIRAHRYDFGICPVFLGAVLNRAAGGRTSRYQCLRVAGIGQRIRRRSRHCRRCLCNNDLHRKRNVACAEAIGAKQRDLRSLFLRRNRQIICTGGRRAADRQRVAGNREISVLIPACDLIAKVICRRRCTVRILDVVRQIRRRIRAVGGIYGLVALRSAVLQLASGVNGDAVRNRGVCGKPVRLGKLRIGGIPPGEHMGSWSIRIIRQVHGAARVGVFCIVLRVLVPGIALYHKCDCHHGLSRVAGQNRGCISICAERLTPILGCLIGLQEVRHLAAGEGLGVFARRAAAAQGASFLLQEIAVCHGAAVVPRHAAGVVESSAAGRDSAGVIAICHGAGIRSSHAAGIGEVGVIARGCGCDSSGVIAVFHMAAAVIAHHAAGTGGNHTRAAADRSGDIAAEGTVFHIAAVVIARHAAGRGTTTSPRSRNLGCDLAADGKVFYRAARDTAEQAGIYGFVGFAYADVQSRHRVPLAVKGTLEAFAVDAAVADGRPRGATVKILAAHGGQVDVVHQLGVDGSLAAVDQGGKGSKILRRFDLVVTGSIYFNICVCTAGRVIIYPRVGAVQHRTAVRVRVAEILPPWAGFILVLAAAQQIGHLAAGEGGGIFVY